MNVQFDDPRLPSRFWAKAIPEPNSGCWLWLAGCSGGGYGVFAVRGPKKWTMKSAHRVSYQTLVGSIPDGLHIDHLCRTRCCVNPAHMEPVTCRENNLRSPLWRAARARIGAGWAAFNRAKTVCPSGHSYENETVYVTPEGHRKCRACHREQAMRTYWANRDAINARRRARRVS